MSVRRLRERGSFRRETTHQEQQLSDTLPRCLTGCLSGLDRLPVLLLSPISGHDAERVVDARRLYQHSSSHGIVPTRIEDRHDPKAFPQDEASCRTADGLAWESHGPIPLTPRELSKRYSATRTRLLDLSVRLSPACGLSMASRRSVVTSRPAGQ